MKRISYSRNALRSLKRLPPGSAKSIQSKIDQYAREPAALANNVTKLRGRRGRRLRVGDWRVIFEEDRDSVIVLDIGPRGGIYD